MLSSPVFSGLTAFLAAFLGSFLYARFFKGRLDFSRTLGPGTITVSSTMSPGRDNPRVMANILNREGVNVELILTPEEARNFGMNLVRHADNPEWVPPHGYG